MQGEEESMDDDLTLGEAISLYQESREREDSELGRHRHRVRPPLVVTGTDGQKVTHWIC